MTDRLIHPFVRRVGPDDAEAWREVRLRALLDAPEAFASTYAETVERPPEVWAERAATSSRGSENAVFFAIDGVEPVGLAGAYHLAGPAEAPDLYSMWVAPNQRGSRVAERLVNRVRDWSAEHGARRLDLWVTEMNERARRFYTRLGFEPTGAQQPLPSNPQLSEIQMTASLEDYVNIRRIRVDESDVWRATRLAALQDAPDAFGPTAEETLARPLTHWTDRIEDAATSDHLAVFAATQGGRWVGLAGAGSTWSNDTTPTNTRHIGSIWIEPSVRGAGLLPRLLDALYDWSVATGARRLALDVTETNERAITVYERYGFRASGRRHPLRSGSDLDEIEMTMALFEAKE